MLSCVQIHHDLPFTKRRFECFVEKAPPRNDYIKVNAKLKGVVKSEFATARQPP